MLKRLYWLFIVLTLSASLVWIGLLLNFTAPNPTGRRYSSAEAVAETAGADAEEILSRDLQLPRNETSARICICKLAYAPDSIPRGRCRVCALYSSEWIGEKKYHIPDFIGRGLIAESKHTDTFPGSSKAQIDAFIVMATALRQPLWVFVRHDTSIQPLYRTRVEATGGGVVPYFVVPGYADPVDEAARRGLLVSGGGFVVLVSGGLYRRRNRRSVTLMVVAGSPRPTAPRAPVSPLDRANRSLATLDDFQRRLEARTRIQIEREDEIDL